MYTCVHRWHIELYLTPSHLVYSTAGVLCALAVGIAVIIGLLQAREKVSLICSGCCDSLLFTFTIHLSSLIQYQDSKEKKQAKHRFHFNAM